MDESQVWTLKLLYWAKNCFVCLKAIDLSVTEANNFFNG
jgi:hypothetical protein